MPSAAIDSFLNRRILLQVNNTNMVGKNASEFVAKNIPELGKLVSEISV